MADPNPDNFVKVSLPFRGDQHLDDHEFRCLVALKSWAWDKADCWPSNAKIAERCGWMNNGKPAKSKVKRLLVSLEAKGYIKRLLVLDANGRLDRERIVIDWNKVGGLDLDHPSPDLDRMVQNQTTVGQEWTIPRLMNEPPVVQNWTTRGPDLNPELDSGTDSGIDAVHRPPTQMAGAVEREHFRTLLEEIAEPGSRHREDKKLINDCSLWLLATIPAGVSSKTKAAYCRDLWPVARGELTPDDLIARWACYFDAETDH